jgi:NADH-quinone oxidoreductase subunit N
VSAQTLNLLTVLPEVALAIGAVLTVLLGFGPKTHELTLRVFAGASIGGATLALVTQWRYVEKGFGGFGYTDMVIMDQMSITWSAVLLGVALLALTMGWSFVEDHVERSAEILALVLLATAGFMFMATSAHFIMLFLGLEVGSISLYVLTAIGKGSRDSDEASMKYFLLGSMASAVLLYGIALLFTGTGRLSYGGVAAQLVDAAASTRVVLSGPAVGFHLGVPLVAIIGSTLILMGLLFKVTAAPFHFWAPDVYQGAPTRLVGFISAVAKIAGFAALLRLVETSFGPLFGDLRVPLVSIGVVSVMLGTLYAIRQDDVKRMLAYSGIAHAGFMLMGVAAGRSDAFGNSGTRAVTYYLLGYAVTLVMTFSIVGVVAGDGRAPIERFRGLGKSSPVLAAGLTIFMLSMSGMPLTSGFVGKFLIFSSAIAADLFPAVVIGLVMSVVAFFFYIRLIVAMYFEDAEIELAVNRFQKAGVVFGISVTLFLGLYPGPLYDLLTSMLNLSSGA